jgi:hypothetical protein
LGESIRSLLTREHRMIRMHGFGFAQPDGRDDPGTYGRASLDR